jgi:hypothetical protein
MQRLYGIFLDAYKAPRPLGYGQPYQPRKKIDFPNLKRLITNYGDSLTEDLFRVAVRNYFASEMTNRNLADLCSRFADFANYSIDRYNQAMKGRTDANASRSIATGNQSNLFGAKVI